MLARIASEGNPFVRTTGFAVFQISCHTGEGNREIKKILFSGIAPGELVQQQLKRDARLQARPAG